MNVSEWPSIRALNSSLEGVENAIENALEAAEDKGREDAERRAFGVLLQAHVEAPMWWDGVEEGEGQRTPPTAEQVWFAREVLEDAIACIFGVGPGPDDKYLISDLEAVDFYDVSGLLGRLQKGETS